METKFLVVRTEAQDLVEKCEKALSEWKATEVGNVIQSVVLTTLYDEAGVLSLAMTICFTKSN
jgi:hypothetical protein